MLKDGQLVCDRCHKVITKITNVPPEGWEKMHNLCSDCFTAIGKTAVPRVT